MSPEQIEACTGCTNPALADKWAAPLTVAMAAYEIGTPARQAAFLAQVGHESGGLRYSREVWGPTPAQRKYEGRADLGNTQPGDGSRFRGRGLIQITGRANYRACSVALFGDPDRLLFAPEVLERPDFAALSAGWFWDAHNLNQWADLGNFEILTRRINGGLNGYADRHARYVAALQCLST